LIIDNFVVNRSADRR